ncbi:MAG: hypothetical protein RB296_10910 [Acidobacteriota bacterium]|jgi:hypothetical protein|nr:hypothetical protein [Acidobacteriota bacterium]
MGHAQTDQENDGLEELESLLESDLRGNQPAVKGLGITREQVNRSLVRLGVSLMLLLLLFVFGVFDSIGTVLTGIGLVAILEIVLLWIGRSGNGSHAAEE